MSQVLGRKGLRRNGERARDPRAFLPLYPYGPATATASLWQSRCPHRKLIKARPREVPQQGTHPRREDPGAKKFNDQWS